MRKQTIEIENIEVSAICLGTINFGLNIRNICKFYIAIYCAEFMIQGTSLI